MDNPVLTVGITTFERPESLKRAVHSFVDQPNLIRGQVEMVVVDDASTSSAVHSFLTAMEGESQACAIPIRVIRHESGSGGPSTGRNEVIDVARGRYVLFLDDDNTMLPGALSVLVEYLAGSSMDWVSLRRRRNGRSLFRAPAARHEHLERREALATFLIGGAFRTSTLRELGLRFDPDVSYGEDNEFVLELVTRSAAFAALSDQDFILEGDPSVGELPHISHLRPGVGFVRTLSRHIDRLFEIVEHSPLPIEERTELGELVLLRSVSSYNTHRKIAALSEPDAREFLEAWRKSISRVLTRTQALGVASRISSGPAMDAVFAGDVTLLRSSVETAS